MTTNGQDQQVYQDIFFMSWHSKNDLKRECSFDVLFVLAIYAYYTMTLNQVDKTVSRILNGWRLISSYIQRQNILIVYIYIYTYSYEEFMNLMATKRAHNNNSIKNQMTLWKLPVTLKWLEKSRPTLVLHQWPLLWSAEHASLWDASAGIETDQSFPSKDIWLQRFQVWKHKLIMERCNLSRFQLVKL